MKIKIKGIILYKSKINKDSRGFFKEIYKKKFLNNYQLFRLVLKINNLSPIKIKYELNNL